MKPNLVRAALLCLAVLLPATAAMATNDPIPGIGIVVKKHPGCTHCLITATTGADGTITLKGLEPGDYEIDIDGKTLGAAMDKLAAPVPEKKSSGGLSIGIGGGLFGGGGSHRDSKGGQGAGPQGEQGGGTSHRGSSGGGGVGLGIDIPVGGQQNAIGGGLAQAISIRLLLPAVQAQREALPMVQQAREAAQDITVQVPYCPGTATQGVHIGFTVPQGSSGPVTVVLGISDQGSTGGLSSY